MKISNLLKLIATGSTALFIAACYGMPDEMAMMYGVPVDIGGQIKVQDEYEVPLAGITVYYEDNQVTNFTDANGNSTYYLTGVEVFTGNFVLTDKTGVYAQKNVTIDDDHYTVDTFTMEEN